MACQAQIDSEGNGQIELLCMYMSWKCLLVMCRRNALKENFGGGRINGRINPLPPSSESFVKRNQTIHIFLYIIFFLNVVPSESSSKNKLILSIILEHYISFN